ncbi:MAG TPA: hypothetical protein DEQ02_05130 [Ruminococcaceae bacterium]|nr:hypothetical protein [Oscillospiraceae bacterium]
MSEYIIQSEDAMSDFIYKNTIVMIHQIIKANYEAGKSVEEVLSIIASLTEIPPTLQGGIRSGENTHCQNSDGMTDYQFQKFMELRGENDALRKENKELKERLATLER